MPDIGTWPRTLTTALLLGLVSQSLCGAFWGRCVRVAPDAEGLVYLGFWLLASGCGEGGRGSFA